MISVAFHLDIIKKNIVEVKKKMESAKSEVKQIASQILSGMLANPHVYSMVSDELGRGQQEQNLITAAIEMAEILITQVENNQNQKEH